MDNQQVQKRKSRERLQFEKFGLLPDKLKDRQSEVSPSLHKVVLVGLQDADNRLNQGAWQPSTSLELSNPVRVRRVESKEKPKRHAFLEAVDRKKDEKQLPTDKAMGLVMKEHPELYRDYMGGD